MSDAEVQTALAQAYAGLRVLERHGERCVLLRRERLEGEIASIDELSERSGRLHADASLDGRMVQAARHQGRISAYLFAGAGVRMLLREADEEAERYGC